MEKIVIRWATIDDAASIREIYAPNVLERAVSYEEVLPSVAQFEQRIAHTLNAGFPYFVATSNGAVVGYCYAGAYHPRAAFRFSVETTIYIKDGWHGRGIGKMLMDALEQRLGKMAITNCYAVIAFPRSDTDPYLTKSSMFFHEKLGYKLVSHLHCCGYKFGRWYDCITMEKFLPHNLREMYPRRQ